MAPGWKRNTALVIGGLGTVTAVAYFGPRILRRRLLKWSEANVASQIDSARRQQHFDDNQKTCNSTIYTMLPTVVGVVVKRFNPEVITSQLKANPSNKLALWNELKTISFAQNMALVYGGCLLSVLLKIEVNILGGYMFKEFSSDGSGDKEEELHDHTSIEKQYLSSVQYFMETGLLKVCDMVETSVQVVLHDTTLKDQHTVHTVLDLMLQIHANVMDQVRHTSLSTSEEGTFAPFMFSSSEFYGVEEGPLSSLKNATQDVLECPDLPYVMEIAVQKGLTAVGNVIQDIFQSSVQGSPSNSLPLAKVIPLITDSSSSLTTGIHQNKLVQDILKCTELTQFSHNIYEAFSTTL